MDLKQIEYIVKIADEKSITRAAEKLFLTQSALNQQLLKLEKDLGVQLFKRTKADWSPTAAGEIYLEGAREILRIQQRTYNKLRDYTDSRKGYLTIGMTPERGIQMFTEVYPKFHRMFPDVVVEPIETSVLKQQEMIAKGDMDIGFMTLCEKQKTKDEYETLYEEELVLVVPEGHPFSREKQEFEGDFGMIDLDRFRYEPFVLLYKESTVYHVIDELFRKSGFTPRVLFETASNRTILSMIRANICCGILPYHYIKEDRTGVTCFHLPSRPKWEVAVSYRRNGYLSDTAKEFIRLAKEYWESGN